MGYIVSDQISVYSNAKNYSQQQIVCVLILIVIIYHRRHLRILRVSKHGTVTRTSLEKV